MVKRRGGGWFIIYFYFKVTKSAENFKDILAISNWGGGDLDDLDHYKFCKQKGDFFLIKEF